MKRINDPWKPFVSKMTILRGRVPVTFCRLGLFCYFASLVSRKTRNLVL